MRVCVCTYIYTCTHGQERIEEADFDGLSRFIKFRVHANVCVCVCMRASAFVVIAREILTSHRKNSWIKGIEDVR